MTDIGFLIIGAEKGGTTSLFEYLRHHPQIHMPAEKELSFFSTERNFSRGWDWYLSTALRNASPGAVCGEASVSYMMGTPFRQLYAGETVEPDMTLHPGLLEDAIPRRIRHFIPGVKLLCVLRDPVERAYSQYRMAVLNNIESRSFNQVVDDLLEPDSVERARAVRTLTNGYIANGEYARILAGYFRVFKREQIMVIFSGALANETSDTVARSFTFLDVSSNFVPENLGNKYRAGATQQKFSSLDLFAWQRRLHGIRPARFLWHIIPKRARFGISSNVEVASYRMALWNRQSAAPQESMSVYAREKLIKHFQSDTQALGALVDMDIPWQVDWDRS